MRACVFVHLSNDLVDKVWYHFAPSELWVALGAGDTSQFGDMCIVHVNMQTQLGLGTPQTLGQYFYLPLLDWLKANLSSNLVWIGVRYFWLKLLVLVEMEESSSFDSDYIYFPCIPQECDLDYAQEWRHSNSSLDWDPSMVSAELHGLFLGQKLAWRTGFFYYLFLFKLSVELEVDWQLLLLLLSSRIFLSRLRPVYTLIRWSKLATSSLQITWPAELQNRPADYGLQPKVSRMLQGDETGTKFIQGYEIVRSTCDSFT